MISFLILPQAIIYEYIGYEALYNACEQKNLWLNFIDRSFTTAVPGFYLTLISYSIALYWPQYRTLQYTLRHFFWCILSTLIAHLIYMPTHSDHFCLTLSYAMGREDVMKGRFWNRPWRHERR